MICDRAELIGMHTHRINSIKLHIGVFYVKSSHRIKMYTPGERNKATVIRLVNSRWYSTRARATKKNVPFSITTDFILEIMERPCVYCGLSLKHSELDRKTPVLGYVESNVVPACRRCNTIKNEHVTYEEMMFIANYLGWRS